MEDKRLEKMQTMIRNLMKEMVITALGMIKDERLDPKIQHGWIKRIQEADESEMPEILDNIKHELFMIGIDEKVLH